MIRRFVVLTADEATAKAWAELKTQAESAGLSKDTADLWIAATAKRHGLPLLTNDAAFFLALDVSAVRPGDPPLQN